MQLINGVVRNMREELAKSQTPKDTDEIRETYNLPYFRANVTYHVRGEIQNRHAHLALYGAHHVLDGLMEIQDDDGNWTKLGIRQAASYKPREFYNVRVPTDAPKVTYPGAGPTIGAVSIFYKYLQPQLDVTEDDAQLLFANDWFGEGFTKDPTDKKSSPALRLAEVEQKKFWNIISRNREKFTPSSKFDLRPYLQAPYYL